MTTTSPNTQRIRVWDLPTRVFHWTLALCVLALIITGSTGGEALTWHFRLGYTAIALLLWRSVWGFVGGYYSRFAQILYSPLEIWQYARGRSNAAQTLGHSPLGSLAVWALLLVVALQGVSGLMANDDIASQGPLVKFVSSTTSTLSTFFHKQIGKRTLMALVVLHVAAIMFYLFRKKQNLVMPMLHGDKTVVTAVAKGLPGTDDSALRRLYAAVLFASIAFSLYFAFERLC